MKYKLLLLLLLTPLCSNSASMTEAKRLFKFAEDNYPHMFVDEFNTGGVLIDDYGRIAKYYFWTNVFIRVGNNHDAVYIGGKGVENGLKKVGVIYDFIDKLTPEEKLAQLAGTWKISLDDVFDSYDSNNYELTVFNQENPCARNCVANGFKGNNEIMVNYFIPEDTFIIIDINIGWDKNTVSSYEFDSIDGDTITGTVTPSGKGFIATRVK